MITENNEGMKCILSDTSHQSTTQSTDSRRTTALLVTCVTEDALSRHHRYSYGNQVEGTLRSYSSWQYPLYLAIVQEGFIDELELHLTYRDWPYFSPSMPATNRLDGPRLLKSSSPTAVVSVASSL